jgi:vacuolar-type H+-ATPase subunit C/Vma6
MVFVVDLRRPDNRAAAHQLVDAYSAREPEVLRRDFYNSLLASFTLDEVRRQLAAADLPLTVQEITDRHLVVYGLAKSSQP